MTLELSRFEKLLAGLVRADVKFITVGGLACAMCGYIRTTEDVDLIVDDAPSNLARLLAFLRNWGEGYAAELTINDFTDEEGAVRVIEEFPLDIFTRMSGWRYNDLGHGSNQGNTSERRCHSERSRGISFVSTRYAGQDSSTSLGMTWAKCYPVTVSYKPCPIWRNIVNYTISAR